MPQSLGFFAIFGSLFGALAAACAFLISYGEYQRHFPDRAKPIRMALQTAFVTFLFFLIASLVLPWLLGFLNAKS
jgi:H+/Cl- antiporter ClcA